MENERPRYIYEKKEYSVTAYNIKEGGELEIDFSYVGFAPSGRAALSEVLQLDFKLVNACALSSIDARDASESVTIFWNDKLIIATNKKAPVVSD